MSERECEHLNKLAQAGAKVEIVLVAARVVCIFSVSHVQEPLEEKYV